MTLLQKAYGFAGQPGAGPNALAAPQANLMASVALGIFKGQLEWNFIFIGVVVGAAIIAMDLYLQQKGSSFRMPILAVAIGFYLPFELSVPIFIGGIIASLVARRSKSESHNGVLFASGLITGEALMGIIIAIPIIALAKWKISFPLWKLPYGSILGTALLIGVAYWLYRTALDKNK
jgi:putative OPT family oligopeptide transporter